MTRREVHRALRALPRGRRRAVRRAVLRGRVVDDPRDRAIAAAFARSFLDAYWPSWALPEHKPHGKRALLWIAHLAWIVAAVVLACVGVARTTHGAVRDIVLTLPFLLVGGAAPGLWLTLEARWNAPEAERLNREPS